MANKTVAGLGILGILLMLLGLKKQGCGSCPKWQK